MKKFLYSRKAAPYVFVLPFVLTFLIFWFYPLTSSVTMSFQERIMGQQPKWIGLSNYQKLLTDKVFLKAVGNSVVYMAGTLLLLIPFPMLFAVLIDNKFMWGQNFFKSAFFLPTLTSVVVAGTIFRLMFGEMETSLFNQVAGLFGMGPYTRPPPTGDNQQHRHRQHLGF